MAGEGDVAGKGDVAGEGGCSRGGGGKVFARSSCSTKIKHLWNSDSYGLVSVAKIQL